MTGRQLLIDQILDWYLAGRIARWQRDNLLRFLTEKGRQPCES